MDTKDNMEIIGTSLLDVIGRNRALDAVVKFHHFGILGLAVLLLVIGILILSHSKRVGTTFLILLIWVILLSPLVTYLVVLNPFSLDPVGYVAGKRVMEYTLKDVGRGAVIVLDESYLSAIKNMAPVISFYLRKGYARSLSFRIVGLKDTRIRNFSIAKYQDSNEFNLQVDTSSKEGPVSAFLYRAFLRWILDHRDSDQSLRDIPTASKGDEPSMFLDGALWENNLLDNSLKRSTLMERYFYQVFRSQGKDVRIRSGLDKLIQISQFPFSYEVMKNSDGLMSKLDLKANDSLWMKDLEINKILSYLRIDLRALDPMSRMAIGSFNFFKYKYNAGVTNMDDVPMLVSKMSEIVGGTGSVISVELKKSLENYGKSSVKKGQEIQKLARNVLPCALRDKFLANKMSGNMNKKLDLLKFPERITVFFSKHQKCCDVMKFLITLGELSDGRKNFHLDIFKLDQPVYDGAPIISLFPCILKRILAGRESSKNQAFFQDLNVAPMLLDSLSTTLHGKDKVSKKLNRFRLCSPAPRISSFSRIEVGDLNKEKEMCCKSDNL